MIISIDFNGQQDVAFLFISIIRTYVFVTGNKAEVLQAGAGEELYCHPGTIHTNASNHEKKNCAYVATKEYAYISA